MPVLDRENVDPMLSLIVPVQDFDLLSKFQASLKTKFSITPLHAHDFFLFGFLFL